MSAGNTFYYNSYMGIRLVKREVIYFSLNKFLNYTQVDAVLHGLHDFTKKFLDEWIKSEKTSKNHDITYPK